MKKGFIDFKFIFIFLNIIILPLSIYNWIMCSKIILSDTEDFNKVMAITEKTSTLDGLLSPQFGVPIIHPRYGFVALTTTTGEIRASIDFGQVYYASRSFDIDNSGFYNENQDVFGRGNILYAPPMLFMYKNSICHLEYKYSAVFSSNLQILLLLMSILLIFRSKIKYAIVTLLFIINLIFISPIALSWYERGQFDLYIALSYIWLLNGFQKDSKVSFIVAAFFAGFKLTALPALFIVFCLYFFFKGGKNVYINSLIFIVAFILPFLPFSNQILPFFTMIKNYEISTHPVGISLLCFFNNPSNFIIILIKLLPVIILIFYSVLFSFNRNIKNEVLNKSIIIFIFALVVLMSLYGTNNHSYRIIVLVSFIPYLYVSLITEKGFMKEAIFYLIFYILAFFPVISWFISRYTEDSIIYCEYPLIVLFIITFLLANYIIMRTQKIGNGVQ
jgi:hypothetical protein